jgi:DeoR/GlpR family transcriptional regulator of sugar metabolism
MKPLNAVKRGRILAWVQERGRVTVADLAARNEIDMRKAYLRLAEIQAAGMLAVEGGGPGEPIFWRAV